MQVTAQWHRWRRRLGHQAFKTLFETLAGIGRRFPMANPRRHGVEVLRDISYRTDSDDPHHRLDIYRPVGLREARPAVIYVHGGGFSMLSKDTHWLMALLFARQGYVVFNVDYRLAPLHRFPAAAEDVAQAYEWVAQHAVEFAADVSRLVLAGESAGSNLILGLTLAACYRRDESWARRVWDTHMVPAAVIQGCGLLQVTDIERLWRRRPTLPSFVRDRLAGAAYAYLGPCKHWAQVDADPRAASDFVDPLLALERSAPPDRPLPACLGVVGTRDPLLDDTRRLTAALTRLGVDSEARYYKGGVHAFHAFIWQRIARQCWRDVFTFLAARVGPVPDVCDREMAG